jgi:hypothetical protein
MPERRHERRRFFRVNDTICLSFRPIDNQSKSENFGQHVEFAIDNYSLANTLDSLAMESKQLISFMEKQHPEMLKLFKILDAKIDAVARTVMMQNSDITKRDSREVNLSATGIAFHNSDAIQEDQALEIQMFLPRSMSVIQVFGKVIYCKPSEQGDFLISIEFTQIRHEDQEMLIKYVIRTQWEQHRNAHAND